MQKGSILSIIVVGCLGVTTPLEEMVTDAGGTGPHIKETETIIQTGNKDGVIKPTLVGNPRQTRIRACNRIKDPIARRKCMSRK